MGSNDDSLLFVALLVFAVGIWERVSSTRKARVDDAWIRDAVKTEGVVSRVKIVEEYSVITDMPSNTSESEVSVVRFRAADRVEYEFDATSDVGKVGAKVPVAYNPLLPSDAREIPRYRTGGCGYLLILIALALAVKAFL